MTKLTVDGEDEEPIGFRVFMETLSGVRKSLEDVYMIELDMQKPRPERIEQVAFALATLEYLESSFSDRYDMAMNEYNVRRYGEQELG